MPDTERLEQTHALAKAVAFFLPPPARAPIADKLYKLGVRLHPELATAELSEPQGPASLGNWRPQVVQNITRQDPLEIVRQFNPELAERIVAAKTESERAVLREELRFKHGSRIAELERQIELAKPEDLA